MNKFLALLAGIIFSAGTATAQTQEELSEIETYLNNLKTLSASFVQTASNGAASEGKIFMAKPNKIRMEYAAPTSVLIVGNGEYIVFNDEELEQVTNIDYEDIPATMILSDNIKLDGKDLKVTDFSKDNGTTSLTLQYVKDSKTGPITLVFNNNPFYLKQWKIIDPQNIEVTLSLYDVAQNEAIDENLFTFKKKSKRQAGGRRR